MIAVPGLTPVTTPALLIVATFALLLVQLPPVALSDSVVAAPVQIEVVPDITDAFRLTVSVAVPVPHVPATM